MSINYNNTNETCIATRGETQDERYLRILRRWFELNSPNGIEDMNQLSDRERRVWLEEIQYSTRALVELCKYINPHEIDEVIIIILRGYYGGFIPHNVRKVYNICKENERRIRNVIGYYLRFHNYSESRKINDILKRESKQRHRFNHYRSYRSNGNTTDNSSYTTVDQISNHGSVIYNNNQSSNSCLNQNSTVNSDKMLDDYMNQKQSSDNNFKSMLDNCFKETEYIKPETETLIFNETIHSNVVQPIVPNEVIQSNISQPLHSEPIRQIQFQQEQIPNMELEEGEIDLNVPEINNLNETTVNPITPNEITVNPVVSISNPVNSNQVSSINSNTVSSTVNSLVQNVIPQSLQNVHNTANTEIDNLNRVRNEINAYIDDVIAKLKGFQSSN